MVEYSQAIREAYVAYDSTFHFHHLLKLHTDTGDFVERDEEIETDKVNMNIPGFVLRRVKSPN
jgi:hypothetical protein